MKLWELQTLMNWEIAINFWQSLKLQVSRQQMYNQTIFEVYAEMPLANARVL